MPSINAHYAATAKPPKKSSMSVTIVPCSDLPAPVSRVYRIPRSYSRESYTLGRLVNRRRGGYKHRRGSNFNLCGAEGKRGEGTGEVDTSNGIEAREPHGSIVVPFPRGDVETTAGSKSEGRIKETIIRCSKHSAGPSLPHYHLSWRPSAGIGIHAFAGNEPSEFIITSESPCSRGRNRGPGLRRMRVDPNESPEKAAGTMRLLSCPAC